MTPTLLKIIWKEIYATKISNNIINLNNHIRCNHIRQTRRV